LLKQPLIFCFIFGMRIARSASLFVNGTPGLFMNSSTSVCRSLSRLSRL
jgi:hypothetical protein